MLNYLLVGLGSAIGGMLRLGTSNLVGERTALGFPWDVLVINVLGSFVIGIFAGYASQPSKLASQPNQTFFMSGLCGGYTTFSALSLQAFNFVQGRQWPALVGYLSATMVLGLLAVWLGYLLGSAIRQQSQA